MINKTSWFRSSLSGIYRNSYNGFQTYRFMSAVDKGKLKASSVRADLETKLKGSYLVSSEKGLFYLAEKSITNMFPYPVFGMSVSGDKLFAAASTGDYSHIVCVPICFKDNSSFNLGRGKVLFTLETLYHNERFHQIHAGRNKLAVANTRRNSITVLDSNSGDLIIDVYPITDITGFPIHTDHNHINSVYLGVDCILFTAHNGGSIGSLIGVIFKDQVTLFPFKNRGIHDIIPTRDGIVFSDTFGSSDEDFKGGGNARFGDRWLIEKGLKKGYMIRGIAGAENEIVVGSSHMGKRVDRFKGNGGILVFRDQKLVSEEKLPFAQVHDIIRTDGSELEMEWTDITGEDAIQLIEQACGQAVHQGSFFALYPNGSDFAKGEWT